MSMMTGERGARVFLRVADVQAEALVPLGCVPSAGTLGSDLRRRLLTRLYGETHDAAELERRARTTIDDVARTFFVGEELERVRSVVELEPIDEKRRSSSRGSVRVVARIEVTP